jgi:arylsulfatase A
MKGDVYDGGHRVPFIVKWENKIKGGRSSSNPNTLANLMATLADVTGADSSGIDSHSIYDELINEDHIPIVKPIIHHSSRGHFAIRKGEWKFIEKLGSGGFSRPTFVTPKKGMPSHRLFNMNDDPLETIELSKKHPELVLAMQSQLDSVVNTN